MEEQTSKNIEVTVKTLDSQSRSYTVPAQMTVKEFKEHTSPSVGVPVDKQRLIYQGRVLQDEKTLTGYNVDGKVIHLVERAPPQTTQPGAGSSGVSGSSGGTQGNQNPNSASSQVPLGHTHDRSGNSYVMLGSFNVPVNIMDPQQVQMSIQQMMSGLGEGSRNPRVTTSSGTSGSVNVQIDLDQSVQSEPRLRLLLAENLLRDTSAVIQMLEGQPADGSSSQEVPAPPPTSSTSSPPTSSPPSSSSSTQTEGAPAPPTGLNHPSPAEMLEMLRELRRVEDRLQPFIQRAHLILQSATTADYSNNTQGRVEDQRILNLVGEALRLLGNALVALSDLRCNLLSSSPRHLHVVRPVSHYTSSVLNPSQVNLGTTVTMSANGRPAEGQPQSTSQSGQPGSANQQGGQPGPRIIRISHQTMEPVVMMQMNIDDSGNNGETGAGQPGAPPTVQIPGLPPELMQSIVHRVAQQVVATVASAGQQGQQTPPPATNISSGSILPPHPPHTRVVFTRPSFTHRMAGPTFTTRGATINLRSAAAPAMSQQPAQFVQISQAGHIPPAALNQVMGGLVGQLLTGAAGRMAGQTSTSSSHTFTSTASSSSSTSAPTATRTSGSGPTQSGTTSTPPSTPGASQETPAGGNLEQLLGSLLGGAVPGAAQGPSITVTVPGVPTFVQGVSDFMQASQPLFSQPPPSASPSAPPPAPGPTPSTAAPDAGAAPGAAAEGLNPELFTGIMQGVLSTMMGSLGTPQNQTESIAQFIQRLSQTSNIFTPGSGDGVGFFGDLLALVCQNFSMMDMVLLLHGQHQPLGRIQPQLTQFFTEHFLQGREPTESNITAAADELVAELEEYITESFSTASVREGVDVVRTNSFFLRQQLTAIATHILNCSDEMFGPCLLQLCNWSLFECLALNLYCLNGEQSSLTTVIDQRIRTMSAEVNPSLVNWLTSMMTTRLQVLLEHIPITEEQITHYIIHTQGEQMPDRLSQDPEPQNEMTDSLSPAPATTAEEVLVSSQEAGAAGGPAGDGEGAVRDGEGAVRDGEEPRRDAESWTAALPSEWVPIIRQDQRKMKMKAQTPLSDAYLHGMPAKRRKTVKSETPRLSLSDAVSQAARSAGVSPLTAPDTLQQELERPPLQEAYGEQLKKDIRKRVQEDPDYSSRRFPNTHQVFSPDS